MNTEELNRSYSMTDSELTVFVQNLCVSMTRDLAEFELYGITATDIAALKTLDDAFEQFPLDSLLKQEWLIATETKQMYRDALQKLMKTLVLRIELKWGKQSPQYTQVDYAEMCKLTDESYLTRARGVYSYMKTNAADYVKYGLTQEILTEVNTVLEAYDKALEEVNTKYTDRKIITHERVQNGNKIYKLAARYCEIGKTIWEGVNIAKYGSYVIYPVNAGPLKPPTGLTFDSISTYVFWDQVLHATSYELQYSSDGNNWTEIYSGVENALKYTPPVEGWAYFRVRARNSNGYGEYSEVLKSGYYKVLPPPSNIKAKLVESSENTVEITWDIVPSASIYKIYCSTVAIGAASNNYILLGKAKEPPFVSELERGKRHYFQLTAESSTQWSGRSTEIFIDIQ